MTMRTTNTIGLALLAAIACKGDDAASTSGGAIEQTAQDVDRWAATPATAPAPDQAAALEPMKKEAEERADVKYKVGGKGAASGYGKLDGDEDGKDKNGDPKPGRGARPRPEGVTRSWFPETFLFAPLVVTDGTGAATHTVRVPDRLTTWRVLALGHSRTGAQGGALTSFLGTLPTYVDLVVPPTLVIGDQVRLPVQLVNTTNAPVATALTIAAENATLTGGSGVFTIPAEGSVVEYVTLRAERAGIVSIRAELGDADAVVRTIEVVPAGRPVRITRTGTLAAPRSLTIEGPAGADPATATARLLVYPGALALLRSELAVSTARSSVADDGYALLLAGRAPALLGALGDTADPVALRDLTIVAAQRVIRHARTLDVYRAPLLAEAALAHPDNPVLQRLGERAVGALVQGQRPDGTFGGETGWTLQRVLIATADGTRAVAAAKTTPAERQRAQRVAVLAAGAFERNADAVTDPYTSAAMLATGAVGGAFAETLRGRVREAIKATDDGAKYLEVGPGVVRTDGSAPSRAEATALAALALAGVPDAPLADLGATLLGSYDPHRGWGDGATNLVCLQAVLAIFKDPVPASVKVALAMDGAELATGALDRDAVREVMALGGAAPALAGGHTWTLTAEPAVPGLGYALTLEAFVPWEKQTVQAGLELALPATMTATVGRPAEIAVTAIAPSGMPLHIQQSLPAGVQVDRPSLEALVAAGTIERFDTADGTIDLYVPAMQPGQTFTARYRVIPTLAGTLRSSASRIEGGGHEFLVPPAVWTIK
jgi:hypothetical protein